MRLDINDTEGDGMRSYVTVTHKGSFDNTESYLARLREKRFLKRLGEYGELGVRALQAATPVRTGKTAASWSYEITTAGDTATIVWKNSNETITGDNIVLMLVRGHGTRNGHYYRGNDFVTPAIKPIIDQILKEMSEEVSK